MKKFLIALIITVSFSISSNVFAIMPTTNSIASQEQGQGQSQGNSLDDIGNIKDSFNSVSRRGFAIPATPQLGPVINYYGNAIPGFNFQSVKTLLMHKNVFTYKELKNLSRDNRITAIVKPLSKKTKISKLSNTVTIVTCKPINATLKAFITIKVKSDKANSIEAIAKAALEARKVGANFLHISAEGAERKVKSSGWGVGIHHTNANISGGSEGSSNISSGGTGYSKASAGYKDLPWIQAFALYIE